MPNAQCNTPFTIPRSAGVIGRKSATARGRKLLTAARHQCILPDAPRHPTVMSNTQSIVA